MKPIDTKHVHATLSDEDLAVFRTKICENHHKGQCKNPDQCPNSHCQTWQRRNPFIYAYVEKLCSDTEFVKQNNKITLVRRCGRGRKCFFAHSKEEELYHPRIYKTTMCRFHPHCIRYFCPFAHSPSELRKGHHWKMPLFKPLQTSFTGDAALKENTLTTKTLLEGCDLSQDKFENLAPCLRKTKGKHGKTLSASRCDASSENAVRFGKTDLVERTMPRQDTSHKAESKHNSLNKKTDNTIVHSEYHWNAAASNQVLEDIQCNSNSRSLLSSRMHHSKPLCMAVKDKNTHGFITGNNITTVLSEPVQNNYYDKSSSARIHGYSFVGKSEEKAQMKNYLVYSPPHKKKNSYEFSQHRLLSPDSSVLNGSDEYATEVHQALLYLQEQELNNAILDERNVFNLEQDLNSKQQYLENKNHYNLTYCLNARQQRERVNSSSLNVDVNSLPRRNSNHNSQNDQFLVKLLSNNLNNTSGKASVDDFNSSSLDEIIRKFDNLSQKDKKLMLTYFMMKSGSMPASQPREQVFKNLQKDASVDSTTDFKKLNDANLSYRKELHVAVDDKHRFYMDDEHFQRNSPDADALEYNFFPFQNNWGSSTLPLTLSTTQKQCGEETIPFNKINSSEVEFNAKMMKHQTAQEIAMANQELTDLPLDLNDSSMFYYNAMKLNDDQLTMFDLDSGGALSHYLGTLMKQHDSDTQEFLNETKILSSSSSPLDFHKTMLRSKSATSSTTASSMTSPLVESFQNVPDIIAARTVTEPVMSSSSSWQISNAASSVPEYNSTPFPKKLEDAGASSFMEMLRPVTCDASFLLTQLENELDLYRFKAGDHISQHQQVYALTDIQKCDALTIQPDCTKEKRPVTNEDDKNDDRSFHMFFDHLGKTTSAMTTSCNFFSKNELPEKITTHQNQTNSLSNLHCTEPTKQQKACGRDEHSGLENCCGTCVTKERTKSDEANDGELLSLEKLREASMQETKEDCSVNSLRQVWANIQEQEKQSEFASHTWNMNLGTLRSRECGLYGKSMARYADALNSDVIHEQQYSYEDISKKREKALLRFFDKSRTPSCRKGLSSNVLFNNDSVLLTPHVSHLRESGTSEHVMSSTLRPSVLEMLLKKNSSSSTTSTRPSSVDRTTSASFPQLEITQV